MIRHEYHEPQRLGLFVNVDGERRVAMVPDDGRPVRMRVIGGKAFSLLMTCATEHAAFAASWALERDHA